METLNNKTWRVEFRRYPSGNTCVLIIDRSKAKILATVTIELPGVSLYPDECICSDNPHVPYLQELIKASVLVHKSHTVICGTQNGRVYKINHPLPDRTVVRVFHNCNAHFKQKGDPDHNTNVRLVATVTVPDGVDPLSYAFEATNHGSPITQDLPDGNWMKNSSVKVIAFDPQELSAEERLLGVTSHRSTAVGDVLEVIYPMAPARRYLTTGFSFKLI